ncbi:MAG: MgtC/SapB family protein [Bacteroidota bacterium]|jgi:putative Mg2+ transporter-C (MgtC) family protein|nr:MgtC/SapB family protein [Bacteroidota bacterium]
MPSFETLLFRLFFVIVIGGLIGFEREYRSKSAGFRTIILICLGSFLFTTFSISISGSTNDRIASNIVTGIGFLGAGVIFTANNKVNGLTTAATIWIAAALGMGIANGNYLLVLLSTFLVLIFLYIFTFLENWIDKINLSRVYKIVVPYKAEALRNFENLFRVYKLRYKIDKQIKNEHYISGSWLVTGSAKAHAGFIDKILNDSTIKEFEY